MTRRRSLIFAALAALLACGSIVVINTRAFQVRYHGWQMQRAWNQRYSKPLPPTGDGLVGYELGEANERYEYHRQKLVELGGIAERQYSLKHLSVPTRESEHFTRLLLSGPCPNHIDFSSLYPHKPELMELTVWCDAADARAWDDFVAEHDVPDYRDRFMPTEKEVAAKATQNASQWTTTGMWLPDRPVTDVDFSGSKVTDVGLEYLKGLTDLQSLDLTETQVTDAGLVHLKGLTRLQRLYLVGTLVTNAGLIHLKGLTQLESLDLRRTNVTDAGVKKLQRALPNCEIIR